MSEDTAQMGRPPHRPTPRLRAIVIKRAASDWSQRLIADELKISIPTLTLHYEEELRDGKSLYRKVLIDRLDKESSKGNVSATKALIALTVTQTPESEETAEKPAVTGYLGKKEQAKIRAQQANTGRLATPAPPGSAKTVQ